MRRLAFFTFYTLFMLGAVGWAFYRTFTHIDMTRTRLVVTFWPEWIALIVGVIVLHALRFRWFPPR